MSILCASLTIEPIEADWWRKIQIKMMRSLLALALCAAQAAAFVAPASCLTPSLLSARSAVQVPASSVLRQHDGR